MRRLKGVRIVNPISMMGLASNPPKTGEELKVIWGPDPLHPSPDGIQNHGGQHHHGPGVPADPPGNLGPTGSFRQPGPPACKTRQKRELNKPHPPSPWPEGKMVHWYCKQQWTLQRQRPPLRTQRTWQQGWEIPPAVLVRTVREQ